jgi:hypothetical protein
MRNFFLACLIAIVTSALPAAAARTFPEKATRGELNAHQYPYMKIGDKTFRLAPGGKIYNHSNLIIMPVSLQTQNAQIFYLIDMQGDLSKVWLLTDEEAAQYPIKKK